MVTIVKINDILDAKQYVNMKLANSSIKHDEIQYLSFDDEADLLVELQQNSLFSTIKAYVIFNCDFLSNAKDFDNNKDLLKLLGEINKEIIVYLLTDKKLLSNNEFKKATTKFEYVELKQIDENKKQSLVNDLLKKFNLNLDKKLYTHLLNSLNCDYGNIVNEINKIHLLSKMNANYDEYASIISNFNNKKIFDLIESMLLKDYLKGWEIYNDLIKRREDEIMIINTISSQLFNIYYVKKLSSSNVNSSKISEILGLNIYYINIYKKKFINYNIDRLLEIINDLYNLEVKIKLSQIDKSIGFKQFLINL